MLRVGLIGLGDVSPIHIHAIHSSEHGELVAVCDVDTELSSNFPETPFFSSADRMLEKMNLDVVHVCLPHDQHYPITQKCVEHDVHVYLEKPLAMTYGEALKQVEVQKRTDKKICVSFQNRCNASFERLVHILKNEDVGDVTSIKGLVTWYRPESYYTAKPWRGKKDRAGYGSIINQSIHTLDLIQLIGGELLSCKAVLSNLTDYDIEVEDTASATFTFTSGVKAFFHATNAYTENSSVEMQVITEKEKFTIKDSRLYITNDEGQKEVIAEDDRLSGSKFYYGAGHMYLIDRFYGSIINDTDDYVTVEDALPSMAMIKLMDLSSNNTERPERIRLEELNYVTS